MTPPVRVAVVGCGWWSTSAHLPAVAAHPDAELAAVVDPDEARRAAAAERFGARAQHASVEDLLAAGEIDGAICCLPHHVHHAAAAPLLDAGVPTLVDKPLTIDPADAHDLVARARATGAALLVGYPFHHNAQAIAVREAIAAGRIGAIEHVNCLYASVVRDLYRGRPEAYRDLLGDDVALVGAATYSDPAVAGGGQGQTQVTHAAALLLWLTGLEVAEVAAWTADFDLRVDLADAIALRFASGAVGVIGSTGGVLPNHAELLEYRILGRDGHVVFDLLAGHAAICDAAGTEQLPPLAEADRYPAHAPAGDLVDVVLGRSGGVSRGELGCATVELVDAMYRSQAQRAAIAIEPTTTERSR